MAVGIRKLSAFFFSDKLRNVAEFRSVVLEVFLKKNYISKQLFRRNDLIKLCKLRVAVTGHTLLIYTCIENAIRIR